MVNFEGLTRGFALQTQILPSYQHFILTISTRQCWVPGHKDLQDLEKLASLMFKPILNLLTPSSIFTSLLPRVHDDVTSNKKGVFGEGS